MLSEDGEIIAYIWNYKLTETECRMVAARSVREMGSH